MWIRTECGKLFTKNEIYEFCIDKDDNKRAADRRLHLRLKIQGHGLFEYYNHLGYRFPVIPCRMLFQ